MDMGQTLDKTASQGRDTVIREARKRRLAAGGKNRVQEVIDALIEVIEVSGLKAGDRLPPETELAASLGVSRSSIREALTSWQRMGIVVRNKGAGTRLAADISSSSLTLPITYQLEAEGLIRTHAVRRPLEIEAVRLAAQNASDTDRRIIRARCDELQAIYEAGRDWRPADARFHAAIHDASGNPLFGQLIRQLHEAFHDIYEVPLGKPQLGHCTIVTHIDLMEAVVAGDGARAVDVVTDIIDTVEAEVLDLLHDERKAP